MLAVCTTAGYYLFKAPSETVLPEKQEAVLIQPGRLQARLILSDGSTVLLDSSTVVKDLPGQLIKTAATPVLDYSATTSGVTEEAFNVITVPQGGEYKLILADGTQVWLNSGSSLKYPVAFVKDSRAGRPERRSLFRGNERQPAFHREDFRYGYQGIRNFVQYFSLWK